MAVHRKGLVSNEDDLRKNTWFRGSYNVQKLHPTLKFLMWNYGSLSDAQERDYIKEKMIMVNKDFDRSVLLLWFIYHACIYNLQGA